MQQLQLAKQNFKLQDELIKLDKYSLLIVDDVGYVRKIEQETSVLFELIAHRYERHSLISTSNKSFEDWDEHRQKEVLQALLCIVFLCRFLNVKRSTFIFAAPQDLTRQDSD